MFVDSFIRRVLFTLVASWSYFREAVINGKTLVGAGALVTFPHHREPRDIYISYSKTHDGLFDEFSIRHDKVSYYFAGIKETLRYVWGEHADGWRFLVVTLIYAESID